MQQGLGLRVAACRLETEQLTFFSRLAWFSHLGSPVVPFSLFLVQGAHIKYCNQLEEGCPYSNMDTGLPSTSAVAPAAQATLLRVCTSCTFREKKLLPTPQLWENASLAFCANIISPYPTCPCQRATPWPATEVASQEPQNPFNAQPYPQGSKYTNNTYIGVRSL